MFCGKQITFHVLCSLLKDHSLMTSHKYGKFLPPPPVTHFFPGFLFKVALCWVLSYLLHRVVEKLSGQIKEVVCTKFEDCDCVRCNVLCYVCYASDVAYLN